MAFIVIYDAYVLYPNTLRDLLIRIGQAGLVQARQLAQKQLLRRQRRRVRRSRHGRSRAGTRHQRPQGPDAHLYRRRMASVHATIT